MRSSILLLCVSVLGLPLAWATEPSKPNFLVLFVDNVGYGDLGCYGNRHVQTPNIDRLATEGVRCTDFYCGSPSCSPSRGAILTGRHPLRNGLNHQLDVQENLAGVGLPHTEKLLPQYLKPLGYMCGAFGKWNIGFAPGSRPTDRGFDEFLGHASGNIHYYKHLYHGQNDLRRGTEPADEHGTYSTDLFADAAIGFIQRHRDQPWFVYLPFNAVHFVSTANTEVGEQPQWQVPAEYLARYGCPANETNETMRFRAVLTALDDAIGRVLTKVDDLRLRDRTVVLLISDNGAFMLPGRGLEVQSNRPLRDGGVTTYEGGIRVPAIIRWPGRIPPQTVCRDALSTLDVLPMIVTAAGGQLPNDRLFDGRNPLSTLAGTAGSPHEALYWEWPQGNKEYWQAVREDRWKLLRKARNHPWELYDLSVDLGETNDLAAATPAVVKQLAEKFERWERSVNEDPTRSVRPQ